jgi:hypothetical protein
MTVTCTSIQHGLYVIVVLLELLDLVCQCDGAQVRNILHCSSSRGEVGTLDEVGGHRLQVWVDEIETQPGSCRMHAHKQSHTNIDEYDCSSQMVAGKHP